MGPLLPALLLLTAFAGPPERRTFEQLHDRPPAVATLSDLSRDAAIAAWLDDLIRAHTRADASWEAATENPDPTTRIEAWSERARLAQALARAMEEVAGPNPRRSEPLPLWRESLRWRAAEHQRAAAEHWREAAREAWVAGQPGSSRRLARWAAQAKQRANRLDPRPPVQAAPQEPHRIVLQADSGAADRLSRLQAALAMAEGQCTHDQATRERVRELQAEIGATLEAEELWAMPALLIRAEATLYDACRPPPPPPEPEEP